MPAGIRRAVCLASWLAASTILGPACRAEEAPVVLVRGTAGLARVPFAALNTGSEPISCGIATAHWYSVDLGTATPGETVRRDLWTAPATGEIFVLNDKEDRMPVQSLWCGLTGRAWLTRSTVPLDRQIGGTPAAIALSCHAAEGRLACR